MSEPEVTNIIIIKIQWQVTDDGDFGSPVVFQVCEGCPLPGPDTLLINSNRRKKLFTQGNSVL